MEEVEEYEVLREIGGKTFYSFNAYNAYSKDLEVFCEFSSSQDSSFLKNSKAIFLQTIYSLTSSSSLVECELPLDDVINGQIGTELLVSLSFNKTESIVDKLSIEIIHE